jgi:O-antigen ligase
LQNSSTFLAEKIFVGSAYALALSAPVYLLAAQLSVLTLLISGLWLLLSGENRKSVPRLGSFSLLLFIFLVMLSTLLAPSIRAAAPQLEKTGVLFCFLPLVFFSDKMSSKTILKLLIWGTVIASMEGIFRFSIGEVERAAPYGGGYTTLALFEAAMLPPVFAIFTKSKGINRWFYLIGAGIMMVGLIMSETRAGWLAAIVGTIILGFYINRKFTIIGLIALITLVAIIPQTRRIALSRFETEKKGGITSGRSLLWEYSLGPLSHLPFMGYGPESFRRLVTNDLLMEVGDLQIKSWHCTPLDILIESGPLTLLFFLAAAIVFARQALKLYLRKRQVFYLSIFSALIALYLAGLTTNVMRDFALTCLLVLLWAAAENSSIDICKRE